MPLPGTQVFPSPDFRIPLFPGLRGPRHVPTLRLSSLLLVHTGASRLCSKQMALLTRISSSQEAFRIWETQGHTKSRSDGGTSLWTPWDTVGV